MRECLHGVNKGVARSLAEVEAVQFGNDILVQGAGSQEVHELFVECRLGEIAFGFLGKIHEEDGLKMVLLVRNPMTA